ncbi:MAG: hypothetical protein K0S47_3539 [Herbinix sp.]|jgi:cell division transport system permease protein|nr:hypothetical protein [Herbinix sp.]
MKSFLYNIGYFLKEAGKILRLNLLSNFFSFLGTGLILFLLGLVLTGSGISKQLVELLQEEAEISAYFKEDRNEEEALQLVEAIEKMEGVWEAKLIKEEEAYQKMAGVLGEEAKILELFDENPFQAYIEVRIHLDQMDRVIEQIKELNGVEFVRDNREVLERIQDITSGLELLGYLVIVAVGITTIVIISHLIRQGIYNNREQINTMRLLGAPGSFIGFPFLIVGIVLTLGGGILAAGCMVALIYQGYQQLNSALPFLPIPSKEELITNMVIILPLLSLALGILGSYFGLKSTKKI